MIREGSCTPFFVAVVTAFTMFSFGCGDDVAERAEELLRLEAFDEATALLQDALKEDPKDSRFHFLLGSIHATKALRDHSKQARSSSNTHYESAKTYFQSAVKSNPGNESAEYYAIVLELLLDEKNEVTRASLERFIEAHPDDYGALAFGAMFDESRWGQRVKRILGAPSASRARLPEDFVARKGSPSGTFVVVSERAPLYAEDGSRIQLDLQEGAVFEFDQRKDGRLKFLDTAHPKFSDAEAWALKTAAKIRLFWNNYRKEWEENKTSGSKKEVYFSWDGPASVSEALRSPPRSTEARVATGRFNLNAGTCREDRRRDETVVVSLHRVPTYDHMVDQITATYAPVICQEVAFSKHGVSEGDVVIGTGSVERDKDRWKVLQELELEDHVKKELLEGHIYEGLPLAMLFSLHDVKMLTGEILFGPDGMDLPAEVSGTKFEFRDFVVDRVPDGAVASPELGATEEQNI